MNQSQTKNIPVSIRNRLLNLAREQKIEFGNLLVHYAIERILFRMTISEHADQFYLKGATLFSVWSQQPHRPTQDIDFLAHGNASPDVMRAVFLDIMKIQCPLDGLTFNEASLKIDQIKEGQQYEGLRVTFTANLTMAVIPIQIDLGFGDAVSPGPIEVSVPTLLDMEPPVILSYPRETVVAEKFETMVKLGIANSRMKDFFDLDFLADNFAFEGGHLTAAMLATFTRRRTEIPGNTPLALSPEFYRNGEKQNQWKAFLRKTKLSIDRLELEMICRRLDDFLMPPCLAANKGIVLNKVWSPADGWR